MNIKKRKGILVISAQLIDDADIDILKIIFSNFYPMNLEFTGFYKDSKYLGYSEHFEEIEEGSIIPVYLAVLTNNEGELSIEFKKS